MRPLEKFCHAHGGMTKFGHRYRGACRACNSSNKTTLSIMEGTTGALLLKCFKDGCDPEAIAGSVGLRLEDLFPERLTAHHVAAPRRRGLLSANEALDLLRFEAELTAVAAGNLAAGVVLADRDRQKLLQAHNRIEALYSEIQT